MNDEDIEASLLADEVFGHAARPAIEGIIEMKSRILRLQQLINELNTLYPVHLQPRLLKRFHEELNTAQDRLRDYQRQVRARN